MFCFAKFIFLFQFILLNFDLIQCNDLSSDQLNVYPSFPNYDSYLTGSLNGPQYAVGKKRANLNKNIQTGKYSTNPKVFNIAAVLDKDELVQDFVQTIDSLFYEPNVLPPSVNLYPFSLIINRNPIQTVQDVCDKLIKNQIYAAIVKDSNNAESLAVTQTFNFYNIPVIGISNRESSMSDKHMHSAYMRMVPPYSHQVNVWIEILKYLRYRHVVFIHSADYDGRTSFSRFQALAEKNHIEISSVIEYEPSLTNIATELAQVDEELQSRVYLLYTNEIDAQSIFIEVNRMNLTESGYVWLISEQALKANNVPNGVLALQMFNSTNESGHIRDALYVIGLAVRELYKNENITTLPPTYCGDITQNHWKTGDKLFNMLRKQTLLYGKTGRVAFDNKGDRIETDYEIINYVYNRKVIVGSYAFSQNKMKMQLWINENSIVWPGFQSIKPAGYVIPSKLKIVTLDEKPFVWSRPLDYQLVDNLRQHVNALNKQKRPLIDKMQNRTNVYKNNYLNTYSLNPNYNQDPNLNLNQNYNQNLNSNYNQNLNPNYNQNLNPNQQNNAARNVYFMEPYIEFNEELIEKEFCQNNELLCTKYDETNARLNYFCCKGYCIDFLKKLTNRLNISYTLHQVADNQYGSFEYNEKLRKKVWNGLVGEIVNKKADFIVAPLTIDPERSLYIDFSKPFKYQGITIISKQQTQSRSSLASFMEPFEDSLWILVMISVHVVALVLYLLDRFSPFGRYRLPNCDITEEDALNLSSSIWFTWGVLLNSGIGEGSPRSFGGRLLGMVWAGFAMIIIASYTGNLAAFLVLNRPETELTGINDSKFRNPTENYTYSTVKNSAVEAYFKRQVELTNIYNHIIKNKQIHTVEQGIEAVRNDEINAFIWDSSRLEYEASQDCELNIASEQFGRSGYGVGLPRNSFWTEKVNEAILSMHESGIMERLDNEWILNPNPECLNRDSIRTTLGLKNMAGVFILVGFGIIGGIGLIMIEMIYKKQQNKQQKQLESARYAADKWKKYVKRKKVLQSNIKQVSGKQLDQQPSSGDLRLSQIKRAEYANSRSQEECQSTCTETRLLQSQTSMDKESTSNLPELHQEMRNYNTQSSLDQNTPYWQQSSLVSQSSQDYLINETVVKKPLNKDETITQVRQTSHNKKPLQIPIKVHVQQHQHLTNKDNKRKDYKKYSSMNQLEQENAANLMNPNQRISKKQLKHYQQLKHQQEISDSNNSLLYNQQTQNYPLSSHQNSYRSIYNDTYSGYSTNTLPPSHVQSTVTSTMSLSRSPMNQQQQQQFIKPPHALAYQNAYNQQQMTYNQAQQQNKKNNYYSYGYE